VPGVDVAERVATEKGAPLTDAERSLVDQRLRVARAWLDSYAPERARLVIHRERLPEAAAELDAGQRATLGTLAGRLEGVDWSGEAIQAAIFDAARQSEIGAGRAFAALYRAFLGQPSGPRAGWLLASLERAFVIERLREAAGGASVAAVSAGPDLGT
jgi:lysyl-tRNA synthetase class 1